MIEEHIERLVGSAQYLDERQWEAFGGLFSEAVLLRSPGIRGIATGRHALVMATRGFADAIPDGQVQIERSFGRGDWTCIQGRFTGTHSGRLATPDGHVISPTGHAVQIPWCTVVRVKGDGQVVEIDEYFDRLALCTSIGPPTTHQSSVWTGDAPQRT